MLPLPDVPMESISTDVLKEVYYGDFLIRKKTDDPFMTVSITIGTGTSQGYMVYRGGELKVLKALEMAIDRYKFFLAREDVKENG